MPFHLRGELVVPAEDREAVLRALPAHIAASRAEPGCLSFEVVEAAPGRFSVRESFVDEAAFAHHQTRSATTPWAEASARALRTYRTFSD